MRKISKLATFFSLSFIILFLIAAGIRFLVIRIEWLRLFSQQPETVFSELIAAARWALSFGLFGGILLGLNYVIRKTVNIPLSILCIALLSVSFTSGLSLGLEYLENVPAEKNTVKPPGGPGLILFSPQRPDGTSFVLLQGPEMPDGARVASVPGRALQYQPELPGRDLSFSGIPSVSFGVDNPWFMESLAIDIRLNAENLQNRLTEGIMPFLIYLAALIFLLNSFVFIQKLSVWPIANLFLGFLVFRGVLAIDVFFNSHDMQEVFASFLQNRFPVSYIVPIIFITFSLLIYLYTFFVYLAKRQNKHGF